MKDSYFSKAERKILVGRIDQVKAGSRVKSALTKKLGGGKKATTKQGEKLRLFVRGAFDDFALLFNSPAMEEITGLTKQHAWLILWEEIQSRNPENYVLSIQPYRFQRSGWSHVLAKEIVFADRRLENDADLKKILDILSKKQPSTLDELDADLNKKKTRNLKRTRQVASLLEWLIYTGYVKALSNEVGMKAATYGKMARFHPKLQEHKNAFRLDLSDKETRRRVALEGIRSIDSGAALRQEHRKIVIDEMVRHAKTALYILLKDSAKFLPSDVTIPDWFEPPAKKD